MTNVSLLRLLTSFSYFTNTQQTVLNVAFGTNKSEKESIYCHQCLPNRALHNLMNNFCCIFFSHITKRKILKFLRFFMLRDDEKKLANRGA
jgi:hypothetical protein